MSRVGKSPVNIPSGVEVKIQGNTINIKGKLGELAFDFGRAVKAAVENNQILVSAVEDTRFAASMWGTARARIQNMVLGVNEGFQKKLEIRGVGYRAALKGKELQLQLGFSHDVIYPIPGGIEIKCETPTSISIKGIDKEKIGQIASEIRSYRSPDPYKGKGIRYADEHVLRKEGKKK